MNDYIAFISYRHMPLDIAVAKRLHQLIERYRIPAKLAAGRDSRRLGRVFRDQDELPVSSDLSASIYEALDHTQFLIVVCTPDTPKSIWVQREISYFLEHHDRNNVLVVLADGRPEDSFPDQLVHIYDADGNVIGNTEPLAANIVGGSTHEVLRKLDDEKLRLFAALIGCSYDSLFQREKRYRARRLAAGLSVVAVAASAFIGMLLVKNGQITARNQELIEQKKRVQLSESTLLTRSAQEALASEDPTSAIRSALAALPEGPEDDRPYYGPAEKVLLDALHVYDFSTTPHAYVAETEVSIQSPVTAFAVDDAGERLFAADDYGDVYAFDPYTGEPLWRSTGDSMAYSALPGSTRLFLTEDGVIDACRSSIACLDQETGKLMWRYGIEISSPAPIVLSKDRTRLAVLNNEYRFADEGDNEGWKEYWIDLLDTRTGKIAQTVPLASVNSDLSYNFSTPIYTKSHGALRDAQFFDHDSKLAGYYFNDDVLYIYVVDLEAGTSRTLQSWEAERYSEPVVGLRVDASGKNLYVIQRCKDNSCAATCTKLDLASGEVVWRKQTPKADRDYYFSSNETSCLLLTWDTLYLSMKDQFYALNTKDGETAAKTGLLDEMVDIYPLEGTPLFCFELKNGYYAMGWSNDYGLYDSRNFNMSFNLGALDRAAPMKHGFIKAVLTGNNIDKVVAGNYEEGFGGIVMVPKDDDHVLRVKSILPYENVTVQESIPFPDNDGYMESGSLPGVMFVDGGALLNGYSYGDDGKVQQCAKLDTQTRELTEIQNYRFDEPGRVFALSDGTGYIWLDYGVAVHHFAFEGNVDTLLAEEKNMEIKALGAVYTMPASNADAAYLADGRLLTAWCDGETLRWWLDTEEQDAVPMPSQKRLATRDSSIVAKLTRASANGLILLSSYGPGVESDTMDSFLAYDTTEGSWTVTEDEQHGSSTRMMSLAQEKPLLAVMDEDRSLRVYDLRAGKLMTTLPLDLPLDYVVDVRFAFGDEYLVLRMDDQQLAIFRLDSGDCVYRGSLEQSYTLDTAISEDRAGHRAYIIDRCSQKGLVLNRQNWNLLANLENVYGFDPERDELYFCTYGDDLTIRQIPDLNALIQTGRKMAGSK